MVVPLVLTRAESDGVALAAALRSRGVEVWVAPCIAHRPAPLDPACLDPWRGHPARIGLTSPRAVPALTRLGLDPAWEIHALAPHTARTALAAGLPVHRAVRGGAAALAAGTADRPFLLLASDLAGAEARRANPAVIHITVYHTILATTITLPDGPFDVSLASPSAVCAFVALAGPALARIRRCLTHGETTTRAARAAHLNPLPCALEDL